MSMSFKTDFKVYLITDRKRCRGQNLLDSLLEALRGGVESVQLREKDLDTRDLLNLALKVRRMTNDFSAKLLINDRIDICLAVNANGVHLPENGVPIHIARKLLGKNKIIGVSAHSPEGVMEKSKEDIDFLTLSPIFETSSKPPGTKTLGTAAISSAKKLSSVPLFALGGIDETNIKEVVEAGAYGVALISGILGKDDIKEAAGKIVNLFKR